MNDQVSPCQHRDALPCRNRDCDRMVCISCEQGYMCNIDAVHAWCLSCAPRCTACNTYTDGYFPESGKYKKRYRTACGSCRTSICSVCGYRPLRETKGAMKPSPLGKSHNIMRKSKSENMLVRRSSASNLVALSDQRLHRSKSTPLVNMEPSFALLLLCKSCSNHKRHFSASMVSMAARHRMCPHELDEAIH